MEKISILLLFVIVYSVSFSNGMEENYFGLFLGGSKEIRIKSATISYIDVESATFHHEKPIHDKNKPNGRKRMNTEQTGHQATIHRFQANHQSFDKTKPELKYFGLIPHHEIGQHEKSADKHPGFQHPKVISKNAEDAHSSQEPHKKKTKKKKKKNKQKNEATEVHPDLQKDSSLDTEIHTDGEGNQHKTTENETHPKPNHEQTLNDLHETNSEEANQQQETAKDDHEEHKELNDSQETSNSENQSDSKKHTEPPIQENPPPDGANEHKEDEKENKATHQSMDLVKYEPKKEEKHHTVSIEKRKHPSHYAMDRNGNENDDGPIETQLSEEERLKRCKGIFGCIKHAVYKVFNKVRGK